MISNKILSAKKKITEEDPKPKKNRNILGYMNKKIKNNYGKYSGIVDDSGKSIDNPTVKQSVETMIKYLNKNTPESNVYRQEHIHSTKNYDRKKIAPIA